MYIKRYKIMLRFLAFSRTRINYRTVSFSNYWPDQQVAIKTFSNDIYYKCPWVLYPVQLQKIARMFHRRLLFLFN